jgi:hypothetical protein
MSNSNQETAWPDAKAAMQGLVEVILTLVLSFILGFWASVLGHIPLIGGWIASQLTNLAENAWGNYEQSVQALGEPIIELIKTYTVSYQTQLMAGIKQALWTLEAAVWRLQHVYIPQVITYIFTTVNMEAATGYASTAQDRKNNIIKAAEDIVSNLPIIKSILGRLVGIALDLIEIDQPELRILLGFVLKELINRLGVQQAAGAALQALIGPILGEAPPRNLHDTIARLGSDNNANASWIANYGQPMVSDLAADERIGQVAEGALAGVLGLAGLALMVRDPARAGQIMAGALRVGLPVMAAVSLGVGQPVQAAEFGFLAAIADDPFAWADALAHIAR